MKNNFINNIDEKIFIKKIRNSEILNSITEATVIIVTYNQSDLLLKNLNSLQKQTINNFEIIVIDNNEKINIFPLLRDFRIAYIKLNKNYGISLARNIGTKFARGSIVIFLDDDAIPAKDFVEQHVEAYRRNNIVGLRGKCLPWKNDNIYNYLASHYDLGEEMFPWYINLEGNSSFRKDVLIEMGGFDHEFEGAGGHEGLELSYRIIDKYKDKNKLIYYPKAVIYHDYAINFKQYFNKQLRYSINKEKLKDKIACAFDMSEEYGNSNVVGVNSGNMGKRTIAKMIRLSTRLILKLYLIINEIN